MHKANKWETESSAIDKKDIKNIIYTNKRIENFLESENNYFIIANKGLGKTLMLLYKRLLLEKEYEGSAKFIPNDNPYLDNMSSIGELDKNKINFFSDIEECKNIWLLSLKLSILSFHNNKIDSDKLKKMSKFLDIDLLNILPTNILLHILSMTITQIKNFKKNYSAKIDNLFRQIIQSKTIIFIDRLDQALYDNRNFYDRDVFRKLWINFQAGLMLGAWEVMQQNNHIKIYTSIRHEAFANMNDYIQDLNALDASKTLIKYTNNDLLGILNRLAPRYENQKSFQEFIGFKKVENLYHSQSEDIFNYMRRHTLGRPRDFVEICKELSLLDTISIDNYRSTVNNKSSKIIEGYFAEQNPFLNILDDISQRKKIFSLLNSNILTKKELINICDRFNGNGCNQNCKNCSYSHPFCELYNIGLLGILIQDNINGKYIQAFLRPSDISQNINKSLPDSVLYIVHPALEEIIHRSKYDLQYDQPYIIIRNFIVGHKLEWDIDEIKKIEVLKILQEYNINNYNEIENILEALNIEKNKNDKSFMNGWLIKIQEKILTNATNEVAVNVIEAIKQVII